MNQFNVKNQEKVLKILINMQQQSQTDWIYRPKNFESNFPFLDCQALISMLGILTAKEYINVVYADLPDSFNIETIVVLPKAYDYLPQKHLKAKERWLERLYGFIVGSVLGSVVTYFVTYLLDHIVNR